MEGVAVKSADLQKPAMSPLAKRGLQQIKFFNPCKKIHLVPLGTQLFQKKMFKNC
jgi:hypothetical protein